MTDLANIGQPTRVVVVLRRKRSFASRGGLVAAGAVVLLSLGLAFGYRGAELMGVRTAPDLIDGRPVLTERVRGGLYALELAMPQGKARWMLEFDAEIITRDGPTNPLELRNALEKLVIDATSTPLVQTAPKPEVAMREAMLAMAAQDFPWLVDLYMTRSDLRADANPLEGIGAALRGER